MASRFADDHDVVLVGYRGVDSSTRLDCPEVVVGAAGTRATCSPKRAARIRPGAARLRRPPEVRGHDLDGYTIPAARRRPRGRRAGCSATTRSTCSARAPARAPRRSTPGATPPASTARCMIAVNPPGRFLYRPGADRRAARPPVRRRPRLPDPPRRRCPSAGARSRSTAETSRVTSFFGLMESSSAAAPLSAPMTLDTWRAAADGDASGLWFQSLLSRLIFPRVQVWGEPPRPAGSTPRRRSGISPRRRATVGRRRRAATSSSGPAGGWSTPGPPTPDDNAYATPRDLELETLLISGEVDGATPAENATQRRAAAPAQRPPGDPEGLRAHDRLLEQPEAGGHAPDQRVLRHRQGRRLALHRAEDRPHARHDADRAGEEARRARWSASRCSRRCRWSAAALRVRRRGRLGRVASVALRSVWGLVLGLGGWFGAALLALILAPSVQIDAAALVVPSVALPVALGAYLAWVDADRPKLAGPRVRGRRCAARRLVRVRGRGLAARPAHRGRGRGRRDQPAAGRRRHRRRPAGQRTRTLICAARPVAGQAAGARRRSRTRCRCHAVERGGVDPAPHATRSGSPSLASERVVAVLAHRGRARRRRSGSRRCRRRAASPPSPALSRPAPPASVSSCSVPITTSTSRGRRARPRARRRERRARRSRVG